MSLTVGKDTKPKMLLKKFLPPNGYWYKLHIKNSLSNLALFYQNKGDDFCKWMFLAEHMGCKYYYVEPKIKTALWLSKINHNRTND